MSYWVVLIIVVLGISVCCRRYWSSLVKLDRLEKFRQQVTLLQEQMQTYSELDLSFLSGDFTSLPRKLITHPEAYIAAIKKWFASAVDVYNRSASIPLIQELSELDLLSWLSLDQKAAQLLIVWFEWTTLTRDLRNEITEIQPWWFILMGRNIDEQPNLLITELTHLAKHMPFFVATDQEGGSVARIPEQLPAQGTLNLEDVCPTYLARSELLRTVWINVNFWLIADVTDDPTSFIYPRVFHGEKEKKIEEAVLCSTETLMTLKHFPGHGLTPYDTHVRVPHVMVSRDVWERRHLPPFLAGIRAGADLVMMSHLRVPRIDPLLPVSLSSSGVTLLRAVWFSWLIVTDDLGMLRGDYSEKDAVRHALIAGNDLLLVVNPTNIKNLQTYIATLLREGVITQEDLDARITRIVRAKNKIIKLGRYVPLELLR